MNFWQDFVSYLSMAQQEQKKRENREWMDSIQWLIDHEEPERVREVMHLMDKTLAENNLVSVSGSEAYPINSIHPSDEPNYPGNLAIEQNIYRAVRWNAMAMVVNANRKFEGIGGHISTHASISHLFEVAFNHFILGYEHEHPHAAYYQGHASPGIYARSYLEYRLDDSDLNGFRRELSAKGLSSYPHPRNMPDYWRYPTVSMGLAPIQAVYQARFQKYLHHRGLLTGEVPKVWAFLGDGEMDEPESVGALRIAAREKLDNLIFVIDCNLQRLDGPVRGNHNIIRELGSLFSGAGWEVIRVMWGEGWDTLFKEDGKGVLRKVLDSLPDGKIQRMSQMNDEEKRDFLVKLEPKLNDLFDRLETLPRLERGGHDMQKIYSAYHRAQAVKERPAVVLAHTVKGYLQGSAGEASNVSHKQKKLSVEQLKSLRDSLSLPFTDHDLEQDHVPYFRFDKGSQESRYLKERREALEGVVPMRKHLAPSLTIPDKKHFEQFFKGSENKPVATTGAFVQLLSGLMKDEKTGKQVIPIIPDESRTFGMDAMFGKAGIYAPEGQKYEPVDKDSLLFYNESQEGAILEEGISEAGAMSSFMAAGNNHTLHPFYTVPFYAFYSMFGFQRIGDLIWAAADARVKGFLVGGISGRTSLSGEGLQHADGQSHLYALAYPSVRAYDPSFAYELALIIREGWKQMYMDNEDVMYYITLSNQSYPMPKMPDKARKGAIRGLYNFKRSRKRKNRDKAVHLLGSGAIMKEVLDASEWLENVCDIPAHIYSVTSYKSIYDDAINQDRSSIGSLKGQKNHIQKTLKEEGVYVAASDYVQALPLSISKWIPGSYYVLGTDGFGQSDTTPELRRYFQVDAAHISWMALKGLYQQGRLKKKALKKFKQKLKLD